MPFRPQASASLWGGAGTLRAEHPDGSQGRASRASGPLQAAPERFRLQGPQGPGRSRRGALETPASVDVEGCVHSLVGLASRR